MAIRKDVTQVAAYQLDFRHRSEYDNSIYYISVVGSEVCSYQGGGKADEYVEEEWVVLRPHDMSRPIGDANLARGVLDSFFAYHWNNTAHTLKDDGFCHFRRFVKKQKKRGCPVFGQT
jgi:hypothetical protein